MSGALFALAALFAVAGVVLIVRANEYYKVIAPWLPKPAALRRIEAGIWVCGIATTVFGIGGLLLR